MTDSYLHKGWRNALIQHLRSKGIFSETVLTAMQKVPRHYFFESAFWEHAYQDKAFGIGEGQTISQPSTVAFQTELLDVLPQQKVLEIGTGSGYQSAVLLELEANLYTIEYNRKLYTKARNLLLQLGYKAHFYCGDGSEGLANYAPYDRIIVTAAAPKIPTSLIQQLAPEGVMVIPVGDNHQQQMCRVIKDKTGQVTIQKYADFAFVPLLGKEGWQFYE
jgi:protein-L-isoaspartate(D-aspartate) O-methyltransferase